MAKRNGCNTFYFVNNHATDAEEVVNRLKAEGYTARALSRQSVKTNAPGSAVTVAITYSINRKLV